jgi:pyruvate dehydrogenase E2 component (dihydrolipoyllysine-residue acetyltransferase)
MPYDVLMPQLGMTMTEGAVVQWLKKPGEVVEKGEFLFIIQTDKVDIEVESPCSGTLLEVLVETEQVVPVGTPVGRIAQAGSVKTPERSTIAITPTSPPASQQPPASNAPRSVPVTSASLDSGGRKLANPRAKKLARELGLDILLVPDYEARGRIVEGDVQRFFQESSKPAAEAVSASTTNRETSSAARKAIAERVTASFQTVPHFYLDVLADATGLVRLRESLVGEIEKQVGVRLSYTELLLKALAVCLREHPEVNAFWQNGAVQRDRINVGFAAQAPDRLVIPVVRDADKLPLAELAKVRSDLAARARAGELRADDVGDASCTLSNLGPHGIDHFHAIINPPESVILAAGRIASRPVVENGAVVPRQTIYLSLSVDHRLLDGAPAAEFLNDLVRRIEAPDALLQS